MNHQSHILVSNQMIRTDMEQLVRDIGRAYEYPCHYVGDVGQTGDLTIKDAIMVLQYIVGLIDLTEEQRIAADANGDGVINVKDAIQVLRWIVLLDCGWRDDPDGRLEN